VSIVNRGVEALELGAGVDNREAPVDGVGGVAVSDLTSRRPTSLATAEQWWRPVYLCYWMRQSELADLLPSLRAVYVGLSAGSMVMTPSIGKEFVGWTPPTGGDETLGLVDFSIFPHLDHPDLPENSMTDAERWAVGMSMPAYAIDDQTAIKVTDGDFEMVSEGHWKLFTP